MMLSVLLLAVSRPTRIPAIAKLFGARVGYNGQAKIDRLIGTGKRYIGGHPNSTEVWEIRSPRSSARTDGFANTDEGYLLESLEWEGGKGIAGRGKVSRSKGWLGCILLGDSRASILRRTARGLPKPEKSYDGTLTWKANGYTNPYHDGSKPLTQWFAFLTFDKVDRLAKIELDVQ